MNSLPRIARVVLAAVVTIGLASCGAQETPNLGTIDFNPTEVDVGSLGANAGATLYGEYLRLVVRTPTQQPNTKAKVWVSGVYCVGWSRTLADCALSPDNPTGQPQELTVDVGVNVDLAILWTFNGGDDGTFTVFQAWSGSAYQKFDATVACVDAGGVTCP